MLIPTVVITCHSNMQLVFRTLLGYVGSLHHPSHTAVSECRHTTAVCDGSSFNKL